MKTRNIVILIALATVTVVAGIFAYEARECRNRRIGDVPLAHWTLTGGCEPINFDEAQ
jgi:hypothetical protein